MPAETAVRVDPGQAVCPHKSGVRIGGVSLALNGASANEVRLSRELESFRDDHESPDIEVNVKWVESLQRWPGDAVFDSGSLWTLFRDGRELVFDFTSPAFGDCPYKRIRTNVDFHQAQLMLNYDAMASHRQVFPLEYPADELLITNHLSWGLGIEVHGCGLVDTETGGHLFLGHSGAGKSTSTLLWKKLRDPEILSDDRLILRLRDGELWMYGTPWHGEAAFASPGRGKINKICILQHGKCNRFTELPRARAVGELFARCFPPFHSAAGLANTIDFLDRVTNLVPVYEFQFVPDRSAIDAVLGFDD